MPYSSRLRLVVAPDYTPSEYGAESLSELLPDINRELRGVVVDAVRGDQPTTVMGLLMSADEPLTVPALAGLLGKSVSEVEWTVNMLEEEDLCLKVTENGLAKIKPFALYSDRNG